MTPRQKHALDFISSRLSATGGVAPTYEEISVALGLSTKSTVKALLDRLERDGHIKRIRGRARSIEVTTPSSVCPHCGRTV